MATFTTIKYYLLTFVVGLLIGIFIGHAYFPVTNYVTVGNDNKIEEKVTQKEREEISYVPKTSKDDADVEMNDAPQQVSVKVNGKTTKFNTVSNETQKFDKGKLVVDRTNQITFDIKAPETPRVETYVNVKTDNNNKQSLELEGEVEKNGWKVEGSVDTNKNWTLKAGHKF